MARMVRCESGLIDALGERAWLQSHRGFESLPHRQVNQILMMKSGRSLLMWKLTFIICVY